MKLFHKNGREEKILKDRKWKKLLAGFFEDKPDVVRIMDRLNRYHGYPACDLY